MYLLTVTERKIIIYTFLRFQDPFSPLDLHRVFGPDRISQMLTEYGDYSRDVIFDSLTYSFFYNNNNNNDRKI